MACTPRPLLRAVPSVLLGLGLAAPTRAQALEMSGAITACHDPSRIIEQNGTYTIYSTGGTINVRTSPDLVTWSWAAGVFSSIPSWMTSIAASVGATLDNIWAPDAIQVPDGTRYLAYYSRDIGSGTTEHAVCGVATATSPAGPWTDQGAVLDVVVSSSYYRVIDPAPIVDQSGQLWIAVGSFGYADGNGYDNGGIRVFRTNPSTGKLVTAGDRGTNIAGAWIEAPFIYYHSGYYYLFFNEARCCNGLSSNYFVRVGRSTSIDGAYTDLDGRSLRVPTSGGTLFMGLDFASNYTGTADNNPVARANRGSIGRELGPGHVGISQLSDGIERVTYHFYDTATSNGEPTLGLKTIIWGIDGWPRAGWSLPNGTYAIGTRLNADAGSTTALFLDASSGSPVLAAYGDADSQHWDVTRVAANRHTLTARSSQLNLSGGTSVSLAAPNSSSTAQRWFIEQTNDMSFRLLNNGSKTAALQVPSGGNTAGTAAQSGTYGVNLSNQRWFMTPVGAYRICSKYGGLCVQPSGSSSGASLTQQPSATSTLQYWRFLPTQAGYTRIINASTGLAMAVQGASTADGAAVIQETDSGAVHQQFSVDVLTDESLRFVPRSSGKAIEVADASTAAGGPIEQNSWLHTLNQQFTLTAVTLGTGGSAGTGGAATGGLGTGGAATGGKATGGVSTGGSSTGGSPSPTGGSPLTGGSSSSGGTMSSGGMADSGGSATITGGTGTGGSGGSPETCTCRTASGGASGHRAPALLALGLLGLLGRRRGRR